MDASKLKGTLAASKVETLRLTDVLAPLLEPNKNGHGKFGKFGKFLVAFLLYNVGCKHLWHVDVHWNVAYFVSPETIKTCLPKIEGQGRFLKFQGPGPLEPAGFLQDEVVTLFTMKPKITYVRSGRSTPPLFP